MRKIITGLVTTIALPFIAIYYTIRFPDIVLERVLEEKQYIVNLIYALGPVWFLMVIWFVF